MTIEQSLPGNSSMEDWRMIEEVIAAVRQVPNASSKPPGAVLEHVLSALRQADAKLIGQAGNATVPRRIQIRTVLFAPAKFVNDMNSRFYNCVAKSLAFQFALFRSSMTDEGGDLRPLQLKWERYVRLGS